MLAVSGAARVSFSVMFCQCGNFVGGWLAMSFENFEQHLAKDARGHIAVRPVSRFGVRIHGLNEMLLTAQPAKPIVKQAGLK